MTITGAIVLFAVFWFLALYMILPLFVRSQEEAGEVEPGTSAGAPDQSLMKKKLIWTTIAATGLWIIAFTIIESGVISVEDISFLTRPES
ncbi:MAG: DUF1467 family protein [Paracoccaceae bacterium]|mgnify:CR=1 FL=1|jgi:predicted secreted protein|nr:DUF1467 family protein [Paracoccaceae bacterium]MDG1370412.1 DUF1467 family protein [Paracoccaceae bacterium]